MSLHEQAGESVENTTVVIMQRNVVNDKREIHKHHL